MEFIPSPHEDGSSSDLSEEPEGLQDIDTRIENFQQAFLNELYSAFKTFLTYIAGFRG